MKRTIPCLLAVIIILASMLPAFAYSDMTKNYDWAQEAVSHFTERNQLNGYPDGTFRPAQNITRAELCKLVCVIFGNKTPVSYPDIEEAAWYNTYVSQSGGYFLTDTYFYPNHHATREEVAYAIFSGMGTSADTPDKSITFSDQDAFDSRYLTAIKQLSQNDIILGYPDGTFRPKNDITRAEVCAMIYRAKQKQTQLEPTPTEPPKQSLNALNYFFLVTDVAQTMNENGEIVTKIKGWNQGQEETIIIDDSITVQSSNLITRKEILKNDILAFTRDYYDRIRTVHISMNLTSIPTTQSVILVNTQNPKRRIITGRVKNIYKTKAIDLLDVDGVTVSEYLLDDNVNVYFLNKNGKLKLSEISEINDSRYETGDKILAYCIDDTIFEIVRIKEE